MGRALEKGNGAFLLHPQWGRCLWTFGGGLPPSLSHPGCPKPHPCEGWGSKLTKSFTQTCTAGCWGQAGLPNPDTMDLAAHGGRGHDRGMVSSNNLLRCLKWVFNYNRGLGRRGKKPTNQATESPSGGREEHCFQKWGRRNDVEKYCLPSNDDELGATSLLSST